jgi:integrase
VRAQLGHSSVKVTSDYYGHLGHRGDSSLDELDLGDADVMAA